MAESKYSIRLAAQDAFSSTFRAFEGVSEDVGDAVRDQQKELRELNKAAREMDGYDRLQRKLGETATELTSARTEQARLAREMREAENPSQRLTRAYDRATAKVKTLESAERGHRNELGRVSRSLSDAGVDTNNLAEEQRRLERSIESANGALQSQRGRLDAVRDAQGRIDANRNARADLRGRAVETAALGYLAVQPVRQAMAVETAGAEYAKVSNASSEDVKALTDFNLRMATERQIAAGSLRATDLFEIQAAAGQGGIAPEEIRDFTRTAATMAAAFDMTAGDAGSTLMAWRAGMGLDGAQALQLADASNALGNTFSADSDKIAGVLRRQGAVAMSSGFNQLETAALSAALLSGGASEEVSATALKNVSGALTRGEAASNPQKEAMASLGFEATDLARSMQTDAVGTTLRVIEALQQAPAAEVPALVSRIFGEESKGAIMPLLANTEELRRAFALVADEAGLAGSMNEEAAGLAGTTDALWNRTTASFERLTTIVGTSMLPAVNNVLEPLANAANLVADFATENEDLTQYLAVGAAGLVAFKTAMLGLQFGKLLLGQGANYARLANARSGLNTRQAQTARAADGATRRLNAAMNMLGRGGAAGAAGRRARTAGRATAGATGGAPRRATVPAANTRMAGMSFAPVAGAAPTAAPAAAGNAARGWRGGLSRAGDLANRASNSRVARWGGRAAVPLMLLGGAAQAAHAAGEGDAEGVGSAVGSMTGGLGGAWAGAGAGAALGTMVLPGVGTAVGGAAGGLIGGVAGSRAGQWIGEKAGGFWNWATGGDDKPKTALDPSAVTAAAHVGMPKPALISPEALIAANRVASPEDAAREVTENNDNRTTSPTFDIKIESSGDPARDEVLLDRLMERLRTELMPMLLGGGLDVRLDASLTDGGA